MLSSLNNYNPQNKNKIKNKEETLDNAKRIFYERETIINAFHNGIFPLPSQKWSEKKTDKESDTKSCEKERAKEFTFVTKYKQRII